MQTRQVEAIVNSYIQDNFERVEVGASVEGWEDVSVLKRCAERIVFAECCEYILRVACSLES